MSADEVPWGPAEDGHDRPYWEGLVEGELRLQRCGACATWIWGPQSVCGECFSVDIGWDTVEPRGTVYSWARSRYPFIEELAGKVPYVTVLVELPGAGGRRVLGIVDDDDVERDPVIGEQVTGVIEQAEPWPLLRWRYAEADPGRETGAIR